MIFLCVGTQLAFDRLVRIVDDWAFEVDRTDVVGQIGVTHYLPRRIQSHAFISPTEFKTLQSRADVVISHAGMGAIFGALELGKPLIIMPRDHSLGEHRNGHQLATAKKFSKIPGIWVAFTESELRGFLNNLELLKGPEKITPIADGSLISSLRAFIEQ